MARRPSLARSVLSACRGLGSTGTALTTGSIGFAAKALLARSVCVNRGTGPPAGPAQPRRLWVSHHKGNAEPRLGAPVLAAIPHPQRSPARRTNRVGRTPLPSIPSPGFASTQAQRFGGLAQKNFVH